MRVQPWILSSSARNVEQPWSSSTGVWRMGRCSSGMRVRRKNVRDNGWRRRRRACAESEACLRSLTLGYSRVFNEWRFYPGGSVKAPFVVTPQSVSFDAVRAGLKPACNPRHTTNELRLTMPPAIISKERCAQHTPTESVQCGRDMKRGKRGQEKGSGKGVSPRISVFEF